MTGAEKRPPRGRFFEPSGCLSTVGARGWGGNAPPRFCSAPPAPEHLRAWTGCNSSSTQALKRFKEIGNRNAKLALLMPLALIAVANSSI